MGWYQLTISPQFFICHSSGGTDLKHNAVIHKDDAGIPYLSGTAIKGLMRESMEEVLAMQGADIRKIRDQTNLYFGKPGDYVNEGLIKVKTARIKDYQSIYPGLRNYQMGKSELEEKQRTAYSRQEVIDYMTTSISQTRIDENGIAARWSLRTLQVLNYKSVKEFIANIFIDDKADKPLLEITVKNIRHLGLNRNRGLGIIECSIDYQTELSLQEEVSFSESEKESQVAYLKYRIKTVDPIVLSIQKGDQNTIHTEDVISGTKVFGALAYEFFKRHPGKEQEKQESFEELFLSNSLQISDARIGDGLYIPLNLQREKGGTNSTINVLDPDSANGQSIHGFISNDGFISPKKSFHFHNSRLDRAAGSSQEVDSTGSIFYYECLDPFQEFEGRITGKREAFRKLMEIIPKELDISIGGSRSVQYGGARLTFEIVTGKSEVMLDEDELYMICQSPLILPKSANENKDDVSYIKNLLGIEVSNCILRRSFIKSYNSQWGGKMPVRIGISPGSVFKIKRKNKEALCQRAFIGQENYKGFGELYFATEREIEDWKSYSKVLLPYTETVEGSGSNTLFAKLHRHYEDKFENTLQIELPETLINTNLTKSQISNLMDHLSHDSIVQWQNFLTHEERRELGKKLKVSGYYDTLYECRSLIDGESVDNWDKFATHTKLILKRLKGR